ncbi:DUF4159 domain-containing protein [Salisaeta longa]|uniref:DUF4159 domain-containing protein n=1 Tax=Salisaeta longa TaxID=503170 RepID=UPI0003B5AEB5|nr:DUF4159 domain-containing protein [Salisaeta longa]
MLRLLRIGLLCALVALGSGSGAAPFTVAAVKYDGGGDWYQAKTPLPNLLQFVRQQTAIPIATEPAVVELSGSDLFRYPVLFLSGHGNVVFSAEEARTLRRYLMGGGFLYVDDDYGLDKHIRRELQKVFPERALQEVPFDHPIYQTPFSFSGGPPKIHAHDGKAPQGFGLFVEGRLAVYYTYETNISDGWEAPSVHHDPPDVRRTALRMGTNILTYALTH